MLSFVAASRAGPLFRIPDVELHTPILQDPRAPWMSEGCYKEPLGRRALAQAAFYDYSGMTVEKCQSFCASKGYPYAGLEYVGECYVCVDLFRMKPVHKLTIPVRPCQ